MKEKTMQTGYGVFDTLQHPREFMNIHFKYGYMNHMRLSEDTNVIFFGEDQKMHKIQYLHQNGKILFLTNPLTKVTIDQSRKEHCVATEAIDFIRQSNILEQLLQEAPEYTRNSQSICMTGEEISRMLGLVPTFDSIEFTAAFLHCDRIAAEIQKDNRTYDISLNHASGLLSVKDDIDDHTFISRFDGIVPSIKDILKAFSQAFNSDYYKVMMISS